MKTAYMNVLLGLINTLNKPSESHLEAELVISHSELSELEEVGFKIDWLKSKLENNFLERKKDDADGSRVQQLEERVKNLEDVSLEKKKADEAYGFRVQQFEESVKKLEMMVSVLKAKLDQEKAKSDSDDFLLL